MRDTNRRNLEEHWRAADDRALASAAEQLEDFTGVAVEVIEAELRRRGPLNLGPPAAVEEAPRANLKPCPDCGHQVSRKASACPSCGRDIKQDRNTRAVFGCFTTLVGLALLVVVCTQVGEGDGERPIKRASEAASQLDLNLWAKTRANVRDGPGLEHRVVRTLSEGAHVVAVRQNAEWYRLDAVGGEQWVHASVVSDIKPSDPGDADPPGDQPAIGSGGSRATPVARRLAYLQELPEVRWVKVEDDAVAVGLDPVVKGDGHATLASAASVASRLTGRTFSAWGYDARRYPSGTGWRRFVYVCSVWARAGRVYDDVDCNLRTGPARDE